MPRDKKNELYIYLAGLGTALPPFIYDQDKIKTFIEKRFNTTPAAKKLYRKILDNKSIERRPLALRELSEVLKLTHDEMDARYEKWSRELSVKSFRDAQRHSKAKFSSIDFLATTTCTGYLCPGLSSYLTEDLSLKKSIRGIDLAGMGCGAAIPALMQASEYLKSHPDSTAAAVSTEICSASFFPGNEVDLIVSNAIFSDGSASAILRGTHDPKKIPPLYGSRIQFVDFASLTQPAWRESLRFVNEKGFLKNKLSAKVPEQAAQLTAELLQSLLKKHKLKKQNIRHWVFHPGGEKILLSIQEKLMISNMELAASWRVLKELGNLSSPSVLFVLEEELKTNPFKSGEWGILCSFGAGFSAHMALVRGV